MALLNTTSALSRSKQDSAIADVVARPSSRGAVRSKKPYVLKPNSSRRTNTARVSPLAVPPPAYTADHSDVNCERALDRERSHDCTLPPYTEQDNLQQYNTDNNHDVEASVAEQAPQPQRQRAAKRQNQQVGVVITGVCIGFIIFLAVRYGNWGY